MKDVLLIDKPINWTSFDVVAKVRSVLRKKTGLNKVKVGHAGTLDPLATGLLIVLIGNMTKKQDEFMKQDKVYKVEVCLGKTSTTGDEEGVKTNISNIKPNLQDVERNLLRFVGEQLQTPPRYSAIKINGQRAYKLARSNQSVEIPPRLIEIYSIGNIKYVYPKLEFEAYVSSGTYIRSLAEDIGLKLKTGAYLTSLRRTKIGNYSIKDAITMDNLENHLLN